MGLLLTANVHLFALDPQKEVTQYIHKTWNTDDGLVSVNPDDIKINTVPPPVQIEKVIVDGKRRKFFPGKRSPLPRDQRAQIERMFVPPGETGGNLHHFLNQGGMNRENGIYLNQNYSTNLTLAACGPFLPSTNSKVTS
jgi:hypothetical protein